jgi:hypothetical protein
MFHKFANAIAERGEMLVDFVINFSLVSVITYVGVFIYIVELRVPMENRKRLVRREHFIGVPDEITTEFYDQVSNLRTTTDITGLGDYTCEDIVEARWKATGKWQKIGAVTRDDGERH